MSISAITIIYLFLLSLEFVINLGLDVLNLIHMKKQSINPDGVITEYFTDSEISSAVSYNEDRGRLGIVSLAVKFLLITALLTFQIPGRIELFISGIFGNEFLTGIGTVFILSACFFLPGLILSLISQFVIEERHGFNTMSPALFAVDTVKSVLLSIAIGVPVLLLIMTTVNLSGEYWWLLASALVIVFQLFIAFIFPIVLAPIFYKFSPLEDGELKERIAGLSSKTGFTFKSIQIMDGSRRSRHANAFFTGFGSTKRIALFDTLIELMNTDQIEAVVAHELGHAQLGHIKKQIISGSILLFVLFFLLGVLKTFNPVYELFGLNQGTVYGLIILVMFFSSPFTFCFKPVSSFLSRKREYAADNFSNECCGSSHPLAEGLVLLHKDNKSNPFPHRWYSFVHYSHPTVWERIQVMDKNQAE